MLPHQSPTRKTAQKGGAAGRVLARRRRPSGCSVLRLFRFFALHRQHAPANDRINCEWCMLIRNFMSLRSAMVVSQHHNRRRQRSSALPMAAV